MRAKCPIEVVPNGVDMNNLKSQISNLKNTNKNEKIIITVSRLEKKNGVDILIKAIKRLQAQLLIVGNGSMEGKLRQLVQDLGIGEKVEFVGNVHPDRVNEYLKKADIFVRPSKSEGLGSAFLEAMSAGIPVIGTRVGGIPDFLKDRETGLFCNIDDPEDLAEKIQILLNDDTLYKNSTF